MTITQVTNILPAAEEAADIITLDETARHRRRTVMTSDNGIEFLLDLPQARLLHHGEGLLLEDGRIIEVNAAPEKLMKVTGKDARHLLALTWQIGNRHLAAQISETHVLIRHDAVIKKMLHGLGAGVEQIEAPFDPEGGAYQASGGHSHDHKHNHHD